MRSVSRQLTYNSLSAAVIIEHVFNISEKDQLRSSDAELPLRGIIDSSLGFSIFKQPSQMTIAENAYCTYFLLIL